MGGLSPYSDRKDSLELEGVLGKRARTATPPLSERVMLYVRQDSEDVYTALHVVPPTTQGLLHAVSTSLARVTIYLPTYRHRLILTRGRRSTKARRAPETGITISASRRLDYDLIITYLISKCLTNGIETLRRSRASVWLARSPPAPAGRVAARVLAVTELALHNPL